MVKAFPSTKGEKKLPSVSQEFVAITDKNNKQKKTVSASQGATVLCYTVFVLNYCGYKGTSSSARPSRDLLDGFFSTFGCRSSRGLSNGRVSVQTPQSRPIILTCVSAFLRLCGHSTAACVPTDCVSVRSIRVSVWEATWFRAESSRQLIFIRYSYTPVS